MPNNKNQNKFPQDVLSNNDLLHYITRLTAIVYQFLENEKDLALKNMRELEPELVAGVRKMIELERFQETLPKSKKK